MIQAHDLTLRGPRVILRPFTDDDLPTALEWYRDEEVLWLSEGSDIEFRTTDDIRPIYEYMSQHGHLFIIEVDGRAIGEVCLERMNLDWVNERYPGERIYRLPIVIGDPGLTASLSCGPWPDRQDRQAQGTGRRYWGQGYGTEVVELLLDYGFEHLGADRFYIPGVWAFNQRSLRLWRHFGFREVGSRPVVLDRHGRIDETDEIDLTLTRAGWEAYRAGQKRAIRERA